MHGVRIVELNGVYEYAVLHNNSDEDVNLFGWMLASETGRQVCELGGVIGADQTMKVWSQGDSGNDGSDLSMGCGFGGPIWNDIESDPAVLYDSETNVVQVVGDG